MHIPVLIGNTLVVPEGETYIVYSPVTGKIARVVKNPCQDESVQKQLEVHGFFGKWPDGVKRDTADAWPGFHSLTLLVTRQCNLACGYCQVSAPGQGPTMSSSLAIGTLDWFVAQLKGSVIRVTFHGGGEPTLAEDIIREVVDRCQKIRGEKMARFLITTNGTASERFLDWLVDNDFGISVSMDGPPDIQDRNRPTVTGGASSAIVERNVRYLVSRSAKLTIRLTYSPVDVIERIIRYFGELGVKSLHLEPLFPFGRGYAKVAFGVGSGQAVYAPGGQEFVDSFLRALATSRRYGLKIVNGHLMHFSRGVGYFCGAASGKAALVTHDGYLTGCLEVVDAGAPNANEFLFGRWDETARSFSLDRRKLEQFQRRHADVLPGCRTCFARYHCAGGCAVKAVRSGKGFEGRDTTYCSFTRSIVPILVQNIAAASGV